MKMNRIKTKMPTRLCSGLVFVLTVVLLWSWPAALDAARHSHVINLAHASHVVTEDSEKLGPRQSSANP